MENMYTTRDIGNAANHVVIGDTILDVLLAAAGTLIYRIHSSLTVETVACDSIVKSGYT